ncbi:MAG: DEAD/DEAH box helicase, partial [Zetaproteobacteria bacterium]|nr:DEAD/DEAH box helicase [Zetaproteobacteria bacterium]
EHALLSTELENCRQEYAQLNENLRQIKRPTFFEHLFSWAKSKKKLEIILEWQEKKLCCYKRQKDLEQKTATLTAELRELKQDISVFEKLEKQYQEISTSHPDEVAYLHSDFDSPSLQTSVPFHCHKINDLRSRLFGLSIKLHHAWLCASRKRLKALVCHLKKSLTDSDYRRTPVGTEVFHQVFLLFPVMSSTFASVHRFLGGMENLGWLFIDEAGQALPQQAVGALMRFQKAVVVGDPLQLEPIRNIPMKVHDQIYPYFSTKFTLEDYNCFRHSVQSVADSSHRNCGFIQGTRVGSPLRVHRRCSEPMFSTANKIAYDSKMIFGKKIDHKETSSMLQRSFWLNISGSASGNRGHWVEKQGHIVYDMMLAICQGDLHTKKSVYIITPFKECEYFLKKLFKPTWITRESIGTIHTFQGREAETVILVLGLDTRKKGSAHQIVGNKPNLLNVAITRAKQNVILIGDVSIWGNVFSFDTASHMFDIIDESSWIRNQQRHTRETTFASVYPPQKYAHLHGAIPRPEGLTAYLPVHCDGLDGQACVAAPVQNQLEHSTSSGA